jgi:gliding motility-associated-like protein
MRKNLLPCYHLIAALLLCCTVKASVVIDSVNATPSTCANNGSIIVHAQTTTGTLLYAVTGGPVLYPVQTSNNFSSLPPGVYTVEVSNTNNEIQTTFITIGGNYQLPDFVPAVVNPRCSDSSSGSIIGNLTFSTGASPYNWELIAPSPVQTAPQPSDTFNNLPSGNYTIRLTDGCNNVQTKTVVLYTPPVTMTYGAGYARMTGCDTVEIAIAMATPFYRAPYKVTYTIGGIPYTIDTARVDDESLFNGGLYVYFTVPNMSYGGVIDNIYVTNSCGAQGYVPQQRICPFQISNPAFVPISISNCQLGLLTMYGIGDINCTLNVYPRFPLTVTIRDIPANNVVETKTYHSQFDYTLASTSLLQGASYNVTITDSCNHTNTTTIATPVLNRYVSLGMNSQQVMLDSTVNASLSAVGFPTQGTTLTITGGPVSVHSTKPGYAYSENYIYPKTFTGQLSSDSSTFFMMANTGPGIYSYIITDSCGNQFPGTFEVTRDNVSSFHYSITYQKGCSGSSTLQYEVQHNTFTEATLTDIASGTIIHNTAGWQMNQNPFTNVVNNITAADYLFKLKYYGPYGSYGPSLAMNNILIDSFVVRDTIQVDPYVNPALKASAASLCSGQLFLALIADSTKGIPPYQYEIINGPQTFPPQASNIFQLTQTGIYTIRLIDSCGNSVATNVTVNPLVFPPLAALGNYCANDSAQLTYGASTYFAYTWTKPDGSIYSGDTLFINPVTAADTGVYSIQRVATINGCSNTETSTYRLSLGKKDSINVAICRGQTYSFGTRILSVAGIYRDTIATSSCDSISILNLTVNVQRRDSNSVSICRGQTYSFGPRVLSVAGIYRDTIATSSCDSISILNLIVNELKRDSNSVSICRGQTYSFGPRVLSVAGIYRDTITTSSCDSISILNLIVNELKRDSNSVSICRGQTYSFGSRVLSVAGIYKDTIATSSCDSISILNLIVNEQKRDSNSVAICRGQTYSFGNRLLSAAGIYRDTIATAACDSISTLNLTVYSLPALQVQSDKYVVTTGETIHLLATPANLASYLWTSFNALNTNNIYNPSSIVNTPSWYKLTVTDANNCSRSDSLFISLRADSILTCDNIHVISIPTAFTPNNDSWNDQFRILGIDNITYKQYHLIIYNRWGQLVFESSTSTKGWDGTYKGKPVQTGNYVYFFQFVCSDGKKTFTRKGNVILLR